MRWSVNNVNDHTAVTSYFVSLPFANVTHLSKVILLIKWTKKKKKKKRKSKICEKSLPLAYRIGSPVGFHNRHAIAKINRNILRYFVNVDCLKKKKRKFFASLVECQCNVVSSFFMTFFYFCKTRKMKMSIHFHTTERIISHCLSLSLSLSVSVSPNVNNNY